MTGVAIVIPMLNEAAGLPRLLRSLAALEPPPAEVLAVDGGSADASVAIAEAAGLLVVRHDTRGRAAAINRGVQERRRSSASCTPTPCCPMTRLR
jgi:glycosyltransferase involved in cell wall biosynthesis